MVRYASASLKLQTRIYAGIWKLLNHNRRIKLESAYEDARRISESLLDQSIKGSSHLKRTIESHWNETIRPAIEHAEQDILYS